MKKTLILFILVLEIFYLFSCAPLRKKSCETQFLTIVKESQQKKKIKKVRGSIYIKGVLLLFNASLENGTEIALFTPVGSKIAQFIEKDKEVCLIIKNKKICGEAGEMYKRAFSEEIPFSLTTIILGQFNISPDSKYSCENGVITIEDNGKIFIYENNLLKKIIFKDFSLEYEYENGKIKKVVLKINNHSLAKLFIKDIE
ncbi:MAG: hypothetical protein GXO21_05835 [Aquificae bacterium]|nr:hypothetical protein [Aquificota bacterium]